MRVAVDLGPVRSDLSFFAGCLAALCGEGGADLDLRVALESKGEEDPSEAFRDFLPVTSLSTYTLPEGEGGAETEIGLELRRRHLEALGPDVVLMPETEGTWPEIAGAGHVRLDLPSCAMPATLLAALHAAMPEDPVRPEGEAGLPALADAIARGAPVSPTEAADSLLLAARIGEEKGPPRLLVDVTAIHAHDHGTGVQRVVRRLSEALLKGGSGWRHAETVLVVFREGQACIVDGIGGETGGPVRWRTGDTLLMLDGNWEAYPHLAEVFRTVRRYGGRIVTTVYDIVPLLHPEVVSGHLVPIFETWFRSAVAQSDGLVCISRAVAEEVSTYLRDHDLPYRDGLRVGWWHLGADLPRMPDKAVAPEIRAFLDDGAPVLLMVGTVEPRKRHVTALEAMERLWAEGGRAKLLILGREGWNIAELAERIRTHPEAGRRLLWREDSTDADIAHAYGRATALLFPSLSEGYGLPVIEAAQHGLGSICSDIPVLREVGGAGAVYVPRDDAEAFARAIDEVLNGTRRLDPGATHVLDWTASASHLLEVLDRDRWHAMLRS